MAVVLYDTQCRKAMEVCGVRRHKSLKMGKYADILSGMCCFLILMDYIEK